MATKPATPQQLEWLIARTIVNVHKVDPTISRVAIEAFAAGMLGQLELRDIRKLGQFDICDAFFNWINTTSPVPDVHVGKTERYITQQVPGLDVWFVWDTETAAPVGPMRGDKITADVEAAGLNFQLKFDTDPAFRADYLASVQAHKGVEL